MSKVLITDGLWRKSLVAIRALGKTGNFVGVTGENIATTGFYSKYCKKKYVIPSSESDPVGFCNSIIKILQTDRYDCLILMEDSSIQAILPHRKKIESLTSILLPSNQSITIALSKKETLLHAQKIGIPIPDTFFTYTSNVKAPVIIKPIRGSGSRGLLRLDNTQNISTILSEHTKKYGELLIQKQLDQTGEEVGVNIIFNKDHKPIVWFTYKRLRSYPVSGGPSTLRESTWEPELAMEAIKLLKSISWVGPAMVEFKKDIDDNKYKLMEINGRFWGSLALPVSCGINFPDLYLKIATKQKITLAQKYAVGHRSRWLIPGDILHFIQNPNRFKLKPSFFSFFDKNTTYDDFDISDISGNISVIICNLLNALRPKMWKLALKRQ